MKCVAQRGATLIELMVALAVGMIMALAIFSVMAVAEAGKRSLTSVNDIDQAGNIAMYLVDKWVRSAGTGFAGFAKFSYGCPIYASNNGTQLLPLGTTTLSKPFDTVAPGNSGTFRLSPVLILPGQTTPGTSGQTSDALVLMSGAAGQGETAAYLNGMPSSAGVTVFNTVGIAADDLLLMVDVQQSVAGGPRPCLVGQTASAMGTAISFGGNYSATTVNGVSVTDFTDQAAVLDLGKAPALQLLGVGDNDTLYSYDLLQVANPALQARADGVFELHALYGIDSNDDGVVDTWASAAAGSAYSVANLSDGTLLANQRLRRIKALRVGILTRTSLPEKTAVGPASLALFADAGALAFTRTLSDSERHYRYRTVEATIPLRNNLLVSTAK